MKPLRTKAARIYGDIIEKSRPEDEDSRIRHPRMPIPDRAKIFAPFAALTGYEKVIDQKSAEALLVSRPILTASKRPDGTGGRFPAGNHWGTRASFHRLPFLGRLLHTDRGRLPHRHRQPAAHNRRDGNPISGYSGTYSCPPVGLIAIFRSFHVKSFIFSYPVISLKSAMRTENTATPFFNGSGFKTAAFLLPAHTPMPWLTIDTKSSTAISFGSH